MRAYAGWYWLVSERFSVRVQSLEYLDLYKCHYALENIDTYNLCLDRKSSSMYHFSQVLKLTLSLKGFAARSQRGKLV